MTALLAHGCMVAVGSLCRLQKSRAAFWYFLTPNVPHDVVIGAPALCWYGAHEWLLRPCIVSHHCIQWFKYHTYMHVSVCVCVVFVIGYVVIVFVVGS